MSNDNSTQLRVEVPDAVCAAVLDTNLLAFNLFETVVVNGIEFDVKQACISTDYPSQQINGKTAKRILLTLKRKPEDTPPCPAI